MAGVVGGGTIRLIVRQYLEMVTGVTPNGSASTYWLRRIGVDEHADRWHSRYPGSEMLRSSQLPQPVHAVEHRDVRKLKRDVQQAVVQRPRGAMSNTTA